MTRPSSPLRRLIHSTEGVSAVEFAFILPIMLVMLLGGYEYSRILEVWRKLSITTRAMADLTTQYSSVASTDLTTIMNASAQIFAPFNTSNLKVVLSEVHTNALGVATVVWSQASSNTTALTCGQIVVLPAGASQVNSYFIWSQLSYTYTPTFPFVLKNSLSMSDQLLMSPRVSANVSYTSC